MSKRLLSLMFVLVALTAACGRDDTDPTALTGPSPTPVTTPDEADEDGNGNGEEPADPAPQEPGTTPAPGTQPPEPGAPQATPAPVQQAPQGTANRPRQGQWVYDLEGNRSGPGTVGTQPYDSDARMLVDLTAQGDEYTARSRSNQEPGSSTTRTRWTNEAVLLVHTRIDAGVQAFECTYEPPMPILRFPLAAQNWSHEWQNNQCSGTSDFRITGQADVADANGKVWSTWVIENVTNYRFGNSVEGTLQGTTWFAVDIGQAVKADQRNEGTFRTTGGSQPFSSHQVTTLRQHP